MIQFFRRALTSWYVLALLGLVLIAFIVTGVQDPFGGGGGGAGVLARVGDKTITEQEFGRIWQQQLQALRRDNPELTGEELARAGGVERLLDDLIAARSAEVFGRAQGLNAGTRLIDSEIAAVPAFQLAGRFDQQTYEMAIAAQRLTDRQVRESLGGDIIRKQLVAPIEVSGDAPAALSAPHARMLLEQREGLIGVVPAASFTAVPTPDEAALKAFYEARKAALTIPERRSFRYALIDPELIAARVSITDADIAGFYKANAARFGGAERRSLLQVPFANQAAATRFAEAVKGGEDFEAAAERLAGTTRGDIALGALARADFAGVTSAKVADAVFALPEGGVSAPIETPLGWRVYKVEAIARTAGRTLAEVRDEIAAELRTTKAQALEAEIADKAQAALSDGATFADVAKQFGLTPVNVPPLTREGTNPAGFIIEEKARPLVQSAFAAEPEEEATIEDLGEGRAALFEMGEVVPPTLPPFAELRGPLATAWAQDWQMKQAAATADAIMAAVKSGTPMAQAFASRGLPAPQPIRGRRVDLARQPQDKLPPPVVAFFEMPAIGIRTLAAPAGQGSFVIQSLKATAADPAEVAQLTKVAQREFGEVQGEELTQQFARAARAATKVSVNESAVARLRARLSGQADATAR